MFLSLDEKTLDFVSKDNQIFDRLKRVYSILKDTIFIFVVLEFNNMELFKSVLDWGVDLTEKYNYQSILMSCIVNNRLDFIPIILNRCEDKNIIKMIEDHEDFENLPINYLIKYF